MPTQGLDARFYYSNGRVFFRRKIVLTPGEFGILPGALAQASGDPHFSLVKSLGNCAGNQERFWAEWDDNGPECINEMLFAYVQTSRYKVEVYHTNEVIPGVGGSVVNNVRVVFANTGESPTQTLYSAVTTSSTINAAYGEIDLQIIPLSFSGRPFLQMQFGWRQINDVEFLGGGVAVVLKSSITSEGYWSSAEGPDVNGFSLAGSPLGITRADLEAAAQAGPDNAVWNKVVFPGSDFTVLTLLLGRDRCRERRRIPDWDIVPVTEFEPTPPPPTPTPTYMEMFKNKRDMLKSSYKRLI
jgi:hypothetical protein